MATAAKNVIVKKQGATSTRTAEACTNVSGLLYKVTDRTYKVWDSSYGSFAIDDNGTPVTGDNLHKVEYLIGYFEFGGTYATLGYAGTIDTTDLSKITGSGTTFDVDLAVGNYIEMNGERRKVQSITSATEMYVDSDFSGKGSFTIYKRTDYSITGPVTADIQYYPMSEMCFANSIDFEISSPVEDTTTFCTAQSGVDNGWKRKQETIFDVSGNISGFYNKSEEFYSELNSGSDFIFEFNMEGDTTTSWVIKAKLSGQGAGSDVNGIVEDSYSFVGVAEVNVER